MDGCMRETKRKGVTTGAKLKLNEEDWSVATGLFADDIVFLAESEGNLQSGKHNRKISNSRKN